MTVKIRFVDGSSFEADNVDSTEIGIVFYIVYAGNDHHLFAIDRIQAINEITS